MLIESMLGDVAEQIEPPSIADRLRAGENIVIRGLLQRIGWFDRLMQILRHNLAAVVGPERAQEVFAAGIEHLHERLQIRELFELNRRVMRDLIPESPRLIKDFAHQVLQRRGTFAECNPNVRTIVPYDVAAQHGVAFAAEHRLRGAGKVTLHGPHYDSWHRHPLNMINLWCAIGPVRKGNGMLVYPQVGVKRLPSDGAGSVRRDQCLGRPVNFALAPGDAIVFGANHLHGSEVNVTQETRCVVSMRMTLERPDFPDANAYRYVYSDWIGTPLERWARLRVQLSRGFIVDRVKRLLTSKDAGNRVVLVAETQPRVRSTHDTSAHLPSPAEFSWDEAKREGAMPVEALPAWAIRPVDDEFCVLRTASGYRLVQRSCPHEGADLAGGTVLRDGKLVCPWHNLQFDSDSGATPCRRMAHLSVIPGRVDGNTVRFALPSPTGRHD